MTIGCAMQKQNKTKIYRNEFWCLHPSLRVLRGIFLESNHLLWTKRLIVTECTGKVLRHSIDNIDYVTGIGNSSREQYICAGQSVSH